MCFLLKSTQRKYLKNREKRYYLMDMKENDDIIKDHTMPDEVPWFDEIDQTENLDDRAMEQLMADDAVREDLHLLVDYTRAARLSSLPETDTGNAWERFRFENILPRQRQHHHNIVKMWAMVATAACVIGIVWGVFARLQGEKDAAPAFAFMANDAPRQVQLGSSDDDLRGISEAEATPGAVIDATTADFSHTATTENGRRTITTPRGKIYKVTLPDGTVAILNADSKISFPLRFTGTRRRIELVGEAYFSVHHDSARPFIVKTETVEAIALGTEFNVKAYPKADCHVTLVSGRMNVSSSEGRKTVELAPGEDAVWRKGSDFKISTVDTEYFIQWKDGFFYFDNMTLVDVMTELGRWYNVNIEIIDNSLLSYRLHFIADRNASIREVVENLNAFSYISATYDQNTLVLSRKTAK